MTKDPNWDPVLEGLVEKMLAETDLEKYGDLCYQVSKRAMEQFLFLPVCEAGIPYAAAKDIPVFDMGAVPYRYNLEALYTR